MDFVRGETADARALDFFHATTDPMTRSKPDFRERLAALRKAKGLTQQALADLVGLHTMQIHRYEAFQSFSADEKKVAKAVLESLILKHQARRWASAS